MVLKKFRLPSPIIRLYRPTRALLIWETLAWSKSSTNGSVWSAASLIKAYRNAFKLLKISS